MKLKIRDMQAKTDKVAENNYLDLLDISAEFGEEGDNQLFQWVRPLHLDDEDGNPNPRIFKHVRKASVDVGVFYLKNFIVKVSIKTRDTHFSPLLLLDPLLIHVLSIVVDLVLSILLLQVMMAQDERGLMIIMILEMMVGILQIDNKVNIN